MAKGGTELEKLRQEIERLNRLLEQQRAVLEQQQIHFARIAERLKDIGEGIAWLA